MRGLPEFNFPAFRIVGDYLQTAGWDVANPAEMDLQRVAEKYPDASTEEVWELATAGANGGEVEFSFAECMAEDLYSVCLADAVVVMPGWDDSEGAKLEVTVAHGVGIPVYSYPSMRIIAKPMTPEAAKAAYDLLVNGSGIKADPRKPTIPHYSRTDLAKTSPEYDAVHWYDAPEVDIPLMNAPGEAPPLSTGDPVPGGIRYPEQNLPTDSAARKAVPVASGVIDYFPAALAEVAIVSKAGNDKHNPGEPLHHARGKSMDHADSIARHLIDRGKIDPDTGLRHSAELAWRALALLQQELEDAGLAPLPRGARI